MIRWSLILAGYSYTLIHKPGKAVGNADALSRCPLPAGNCAFDEEEPALLVDCLSSSLITSYEVAAQSPSDPLLGKVLNWVRRGWPEGKLAEEFSPFKARREELAIQGNCLLWGDRVIVPDKLRERVLATLHECHPGIVRMKALARSFVWWPALDKDIEQLVARCPACQQSRPAPPKSPPQMWERPRGPWSRLHLDFAGPMQGQMFLIVIDALSKWMEVHLMKDTTATALSSYLDTLFITHGLPDVVVSDNGPQFTAKHFQEFLAARGIKHLLTAPNHPSSNGLAERAVRTLKEALSRLAPGNWKVRVDSFLRWQHITPCKSTGKSPAELLFGRKIRSVLDRLHPDYAPGTGQQSKRSLRSFTIGDTVWARNFGQGLPWEQGTIEGVVGSCSYTVRTSDGRLWHRHIDQLRGAPGKTIPSNAEDVPNVEHYSSPGLGDMEDDFEPPELGPFLRWANNDVQGALPPPDPTGVVPVGSDSSPPSSGVEIRKGDSSPRRSSRARRKPAHLKNFVVG